MRAELSDEIPGASYEAVLTPWLAVQPDVQYVRHSGRLRQDRRRDGRRS